MKRFTQGHRAAGIQSSLHSRTALGARVGGKPSASYDLLRKSKSAARLTPDSLEQTGLRTTDHFASAKQQHAA
jgi:hypothetical protein